jgi:hypothetical protein
MGAIDIGNLAIVTFVMLLMWAIFRPRGRS